MGKIYTIFVWFWKSPKSIKTEAEEELDEDGKIPTILESEVVKATKDLQRKKATGDNIPVDLRKELGDSGLKIMSAFVNKIFMRGDWPKDFLDVTMIAYQRITKQWNAATTEQLVSFHILDRLVPLF